MLIKSYNPDVLTCLANLSNDEVFTPPKLVNEILDHLPTELWNDPNSKFLDPGCKSGVFLREITKRLLVGLKSVIPDQKNRVNHIFNKQLYGIAITELTALLSRRSVYCSKTANGKYTVAENFTDLEGNIRFQRIQHTWVKGRCISCNANQDAYDRSDVLEAHAYEFIHKQAPKNILKMKFDVIIGNPPYQLNDGGFGKSALPIYHKFVLQAKKLNPRYLTMIIPSRWFAGGKGLDDFRSEMLNDSRIRKLVDFEDASECFPGVDIAGGICYFLWQKDSEGPCEVINMHKNKADVSSRNLNEFRTLIRHNQAVPIIRKIVAKKEKSMSEQVSSRKPFGLSTNDRPSRSGDIKLRWNKGEGPFRSDRVLVGNEMIDAWKVITSKVSYDHAGRADKNGMRKVLSIVDILPPGTICTETYILAGCFQNEAEAINLSVYLKTKFLRFLVSQLSFSQDITKNRFFFVPVIDTTLNWTDEQLYRRFKLTISEINFIESKIRPME